MKTPAIRSMGLIFHCAVPNVIRLRLVDKTNAPVRPLCPSKGALHILRFCLLRRRGVLPGVIY